MQLRLSFALSVIGMLLVALAPARCVQGADEATAKKYEQMIDKAVGFLATKAQANDGSYNAAAGPAVTALVTTGLLRHGRSPADPQVAKSLKYLEGFVRDDGGIHAEETNYKNYETCLAVVCFQEANRNGKYDAVLKKADQFIKENQWGSAGDKGPEDFEYGGAGYGKHKRPDLSNTNFMIDALKATGNAADSQAMQRALLFVSRCQNLESEHNSTPFAAKNPDGGFYYTPAAGGSSQAGQDETTGALRSYGSMTYAGLKSMIYAGVKPDDQRVKAAVGWLKKNYDLESNPGMADAGLYYYYHTFAKSLAALGEDKFVDDKGVAHDWRKELIDELASRQRPDGSWVNENSRWLEGDASLVSGYALLALSYCKE
ncbi:MAG: prenyltransferase/squalene oxidase repeat-containing protein [Pirellulaceae bacterium]